MSKSVSSWPSLKGLMGLRFSIGEEEAASRVKKAWESNRGTPFDGSISLVSQELVMSNRNDRKLVHKLRTRTSEPMSTATCTLKISRRTLYNFVSVVTDSIYLTLPRVSGVWQPDIPNSVGYNYGL